MRHVYLHRPDVRWLCSFFFATSAAEGIFFPIFVGRAAGAVVMVLHARNAESARSTSIGVLALVRGSLRLPWAVLFFFVNTGAIVVCVDGAAMMN